LTAPALVAVDEEPQAFRALFEAARQRGARVGWLDLAQPVEPPAELAAALEVGAFKSVSATAGKSVAVKATRGAPVLRDLLREHFPGCALVLVRGREGRPRLVSEAGAYRLERTTDRTLRLEPGPLVEELLRPRHRA
jgi:hypothetical protein